MEMLHPMNKSRSIEALFSFYKQPLNAGGKILPEDLFNLITGKSEELLRSDLEEIITYYLKRKSRSYSIYSSNFEEYLDTAKSSQLSEARRKLFRIDSVHSQKRNEKQKSLQNISKDTEEGIGLGDFKKIEFHTSQFPDLYYVLIYVLFGQGALDYVLQQLKVPYFKVNEMIEEDFKQDKKIKLKLEKSPNVKINIEKDPIMKKKAVKRIKQTYPFRSFPTFIKKQLYNKMVILTSELLDYNYFYYRLVITQTSFVINSSVLFGHSAPKFAMSLFFQIAEQDKHPGVEEIQFPTLVNYAYQKLFRKNLFPQVRNIEAFNLYDMNKDGRITSEDLAVIETSREQNIDPRLRVELMRVKEALTDIMFAPKGFRNPYIDQVIFNKATFSQSALFPLIQECILSLKEEELRGKNLILYKEMEEHSEDKESSHPSQDSEDTESSADIAIPYIKSTKHLPERQLFPRYK